MSADDSAWMLSADTLTMISLRDQNQPTTWSGAPETITDIDYTTQCKTSKVNATQILKFRRIIGFAMQFFEV